MNNQAPSIFGANWEDLAIKATINLYRKNQKYNLLYGPLDSLSVPEVEYISHIVQPYQDDFYVWLTRESKNDWRTFKNITIAAYFISTEVEDKKGNIRKIYPNLWKTTNRDIIESAMHQKEIHIVNDNPTRWNDIKNIQVKPEEMVVYKAIKNFDNYVEINYSTT